jgi:hypothetical protein
LLPASTTVLVTTQHQQPPSNPTPHPAATTALPTPALLAAVLPAHAVWACLVQQLPAAAAAAAAAAATFGTSSPACINRAVHSTVAAAVATLLPSGGCSTLHPSCCWHPCSAPITPILHCGGPTRNTISPAPAAMPFNHTTRCLCRVRLPLLLACCSSCSNLPHCCCWRLLPCLSFSPACPGLPRGTAAAAGAPLPQPHLLLTPAPWYRRRCCCCRRPRHPLAAAQACPMSPLLLLLLLVGPSLSPACSGLVSCSLQPQPGDQALAWRHRCCCCCCCWWCCTCSLPSGTAAATERSCGCQQPSPLCTPLLTPSP